MIPIEPVNPLYNIPGRLQGRVLLITGAAIESIGGCIAIRAAREGAKVTCIDRKVKELHVSVTEIRAEGGEAIAIVADVSNSMDADRMVHQTVEASGKLDLVLNAAGVMEGTDPAAPADFPHQKMLLPAMIHEATDEYWEKVLASNSTGLFYSMRAALKQMVAQSLLQIGDPKHRGATPWEQADVHYGHGAECAPHRNEHHI